MKLPFEPGQHLCTWELPDGRGGLSRTPGQLNVEPGKWPSAVVYGNMPVWRSGPSGAIATFPQRYEFDCLKGQLASGAHVALLLGEISYWIDTQGNAAGSLAVLSLTESPVAGPPEFASIEFQIEGIEAVVDTTPVRGSLNLRERTWSGELNTDASWSWSADGVIMTVSYNHSINAFDGYGFGVTSRPTIRITCPEKLSIVDWWEQWVMPLRRLVSVVTAAPRGVQYLFGLERDDSEPLRKAQVFGMDIAQEPMDSLAAHVRTISSSIKVDTDGVNLLDLLVRWRKLAEGRHPLVETYGDLATMRDQHPRSRFLLLLQTLEGLHGYETKHARDQRQVDHSAKREAFLERIVPTLDRTDGKFLTKFLMKRLPEGLEVALISILKRLPLDVRPELEALDLTAQVRCLDDVPDDLRVESVLVKVRNLLSHGSSQFAPNHLDAAAKVLDRVVRSEAARLVGAPDASRERALRKPDH